MSLVYRRIVEILWEKGIDFKEYEHEAVYTCKQAAKVRGLEDESGGIKVLFFKTPKQKFILVLGPGSERVDDKLIAKLVGVKSIKLASPEEVKRVTGVEIGCVAPFGYYRPINTYLGNALFKEKYLYFNPGSHTKTIRIESTDLLKILPDATRFS